MGTCGCNAIEEYPKLNILKLDEEKEKLLKNKIGSINFKDLFMESLSKEFLDLFRKNENLFYAKTFLEGICKEYGLLGRSKNIKEAYKIYKDGADNKYDYMCMYRLHRIYLDDYEKFNLKRNYELDRLYLYKCYAYIPYLIIDQTYYILNKINITNELEIYSNYLDESKFTNLGLFINFLKTHYSEFKITKNDISLMEFVISSIFNAEVKNDYQCLDSFLEIKKENNDDMAYYEAQLKYCNFYIEYSGDKCDKKKVNDIFDKLINSEYYKAAFDYGKFLMEDGKFDEAKKIFKLGMDKSEQFCLAEYTFLLLNSYELNQMLNDYKITSHFLNNICLTICIEKLSITSFYYTIYYLAKHSTFKDKIINDYRKYVLEIYKNKEVVIEVEKAQSLLDKLSEKYQIESYLGFGRMCYYGIPNLIESNKEKALIIFKKGYKLAKEKEYNYLKRLTYLYMYKSRKYLFKNNKITLRKLNKTKEKLFRIYEDEDTEESNLDIIELYNYYKLYKFGVIGNTLPKMLGFLKSGKKKKIIYHFIEFVYKEKCRFALENEYSTYNLNQYNLILKNEFMENKDNINLIFKSTEGGSQYELSVPLTAQFIKVIHILFNKYPELESKKIGTYIFNANKIKLFDTVSENDLKNGSIILIVHVNSNNNKLNDNTQKENINTVNQNNISVHVSQNEEINNNENIVDEQINENNENNENQNSYVEDNGNQDEGEREEQNNYENNNSGQEGGENNDNNNNEYADDNGEEQENNNYEENQNNSEDNNEENQNNNEGGNNEENEMHFTNEEKNEVNENIKNSENNLSNNENNDNKDEYEEVEEEIEVEESVENNE